MPRLLNASGRICASLWLRTWRQAVIAIAVLASLTSCKGAQEPVVLPPELIGVWKTDDPRYVGRSFELRVDTITLSMGEDGNDSYPIQKLEKRQDPRGTSYFLTYRNSVEGIEDTLSFDYEMREGGAITFKNQRSIVWKKEPKPGDGQFRGNRTEKGRRQ